MPFSKSSTNPDQVELGVLGRPRGVKGALLFWPHDSTSETIFDLEAITVDGKPYALLAARALLKGIEVQLEGVDSMDAAKALTHAKVTIDKAALPALDEDEYYLEDLRGLPVEDENGIARGTIIGFTDTGSQVLLEVKTAPGEIVLVPAISAFIINVVPKTKVVLRAIEGLFE